MTTENTPETDIKEPIKSLPTSFSPKVKNRFLLKFDGIDPFLVKNIELPEFLITGNAIQPSKEMIVYLNCPETPSAEIQVMNTIKKQVSGTGLETAKICFLDQVGTIVSEYEFHNPKIVSFKISDLSYQTTGFLEMIIKLSYDAFVIPR